MAEDLTDALKRLQPRQRGRGRLPPAQARPALAGGRGVSSAAGGSGGGIASPLTEGDRAARTYHQPVVLYSSDGLFSFTVERLASITMSDANGQDVTFQFSP